MDKLEMCPVIEDVIGSFNEISNKFVREFSSLTKEYNMPNTHVIVTYSENKELTLGFLFDIKELERIANSSPVQE